MTNVKTTHSKKSIKIIKKKRREGKLLSRTTPDFSRHLAFSLICHVSFPVEKFEIL